MRLPSSTPCHGDGVPEMRLGLPSLVPIDHAVPLRTEKLGPPDPYCAVTVHLVGRDVAAVHVRGLRDAAWRRVGPTAACAILTAALAAVTGISQGLGACRSCCGSAARHHRGGSASTAAAQAARVSRANVAAPARVAVRANRLSKYVMRHSPWSWSIVTVWPYRDGNGQGLSTATARNDKMSHRSNLLALNILHITPYWRYRQQISSVYHCV